MPEMGALMLGQLAFFWSLGFPDSVEAISPPALAAFEPVASGRFEIGYPYLHGYGPLAYAAFERADADMYGAKDGRLGDVPQPRAGMPKCRGDRPAQRRRRR